MSLHRRVRSFRSWSNLGAMLVIGVTCAAAAPAANSPQSEDQTIRFLNQTVDWYRRMSATGQSSVTSQDVLYRDTIRKQAHYVAVLGFRFARNQAELLDEREATAPSATTARGTTSDNRAQQLAGRLAVAERRVTELETRQTTLDAELRSGAATTRPALVEERATVASQLNFASALRDTLRQYSAFSARVQGGVTGNVRRQVEDLARTVPEVADTTDAGASAATTQPSTAAPAPAEAIRPEAAGIVRLATELIALSQRMGELSSLANQTAELSKANDSVRDPIRAELQAEVSRADALASSTRPSDGPAAQQRELDALADRFRALSGAAVPIGEQKILLDRTHDALLEWRRSLGQQYAGIVRHLVFRLVVMGVVILVVLGVSALWRRATFRYISDTRRQRQFLLLRRIVVGALVTLILVAGFVAEFGSLATFAGLITAGIAVAMQTVILSAVAYFFFIGRYGVRVGDRVTVGGVTGDVVDVGLFRLYLMELGGTYLKQKPTGRVAVFSNSVLFASTGFFRQIPGADYAWHEVALTLAPTGNYRLAEERLMRAVEGEYAKYQEDLHRQHTAAARAFHVPMPDPKPEGRLRFVDAGLEFVLRYPVELRQAAETDDRVTRALLDAIAGEPTLKLVAAGTPTVQPAG